MANQGALFRGAIADFQVVVCTAVVPFNLNRETEVMWTEMDGVGFKGFYVRREPK